MTDRNLPETKRRLQSILQGAFAGPPTPLKDIPKRNGDPRSKSQNGSHPSELERGVSKRRKTGRAD